MSFPRYERYKGSAVEFLGEVPAHWEVTKLGRVISRNEGGVWGADPDGSCDTIVLRSTEQTERGAWCITEPCLRKLTEAERASSLLMEGDLLITKSSGSALHIGKTTIVDKQVASLGCAYSNFMQRVRTCPDKLNPRFCWYVLNSRIGRLQFDVLSNTSTGLANITASVLNALTILLPALDEQEAICRFLDAEIRKVDVLTREQQHLIELLKEKRQAVISHAVTKGLDPTVPLEDSGNSWIGPIPSHWKLARIKHLVTHVVDCLHSTPTYDGDLLYPAIRTADLERGRLLLDQARLVSEDVYRERTQRLEPEQGDVLYSREGERFGMAALVPPDTKLCLGQRMMMFRCSTQATARFLMWLLNSSAIYEQVQQRFAGPTAPHVNISEIVNFQIPVPPPMEQERIGAQIELVTSRIDELVSVAESAIALLNEHRFALVSAAVTGKIDVRNHVPREISVPEELCEPA